MTLPKRKRPTGVNQPAHNLFCGSVRRIACDEPWYSPLPETANSGSSLSCRRRFRPVADILFLSALLSRLKWKIHLWAFGEQSDNGPSGAIFPHTPNEHKDSPNGDTRRKRSLIAAVILFGIPTVAPTVASAATLAGQPDHTVRALEALASKGSARAQYELGLRYEAGNGVNRDERLALSLYCRAARQDYAEAAFRAGRMHMAGKGTVARDDDLGRSWMRRAAFLGHEESQRYARASNGKSKMPDRCEPPSIRWGVIRTPPKEIRNMVHKIAPTYGLDPELVLAVIAVESGYRVDVVSNKNAMGLMQLIPETAERFGVTKPFDTEQNLRGGMKYLRWLLAYFDGNVPLALAGYNAGEGAVLQYKGIPPYRETKDYVVKVQSVYPRRHHPHDPNVVRSAGLAAAKQEEVADLSVSPKGRATAKR
jgi:Soluble lytic murein transglycosylase and related regulatory proteins (some contain LysM/invasin domains)